MAMTVEELTAIDDIGPRIAEAICEFFASETNRHNVEVLRANGVTMAMAEDDGGDTSDRLSGEIIVISGTFSKHSRDEYKELIERHGGKNAGSISKKRPVCSPGKTWGRQNWRRRLHWESISLMSPPS